MTGEHGHLQYGEQVIPYRIVRRHGAAFFKLLERVMPDWEQRKQRLEQFMA